MSFETEYHRRVRRALGVLDDDTTVSISEETRSSFDTGCDTCGYGAADPYTITVEISEWRDRRHHRVAYRTYESMSSFLDALFQVDDED